MQCRHPGCKSEAAPDRKQCEPHLAYARNYQKKRRDSLLKEGLCSRCGGASRMGKTMCQVCADMWNQYLKTRRNGD